MQKPFKRHPMFDVMLKAILCKDPEARLLLHGDPSPHIMRIMVDRLKDIGADLTRIHFIPVQPHSRLMALYMHADVILDSYFAGGCTTTREAFEVDGLVVTLPTEYLGGRWTYGYYNIMGVHDLIAKTQDEYVDIAVELATNKPYNKHMKAMIRANLSKLHHQMSAVEAWDALLMDVLSKKYKSLRRYA